MPQSAEIKIGRRTLSLSHVDKVLYPATGFTKGQVIDYYVRVSKVLLRHLKNRALTLKRYPNGVDAPFFYEKECPGFRPKWLEVAATWSEPKQREIHYCLANDLASLVWIASLADLELHTSLARYGQPDRPTMVVFDLDPGPGADVLACAQVAFWLRDVLAKISLRSFPKTSGSKGLQLYVPLNTPVSFDETKDFARVVAFRMAEQFPKLVLAQNAKVLRKGKVLIDWSQNDHHKTTVCVYSLRAKERPSVSTPMTWPEVERGWGEKDIKQFNFSPETVIERVASRGDLFEPVLSTKQKLPQVR